MRDRDQAPPLHDQASAVPVRRQLPALGLQAAGNRALAAFYTRNVSDAPETDVAPPAPAPAPATVRSAAVADAPVKKYIGPFDRTPLAAPGERIIFEGAFTDPSPADYQVEFSTTGGAFNTPAGPDTVTVAGLDSGNINFFVPLLWNGAGPMQVVLRVRKIADNSVVRTETWNIGLKTNLPTTMTQREATGERPLPSVYHYDIGPVQIPMQPPFYEHQTILEKFTNWRLANVAPADIAEPYRTQNGLTTADEVSRHFLADYAGSNGTFTVDHDDAIADRHNGHPDLRNLVANLATPKPVEVALPQTYEIKPGVPLGNYVITRILQADGTTWKMKKG